MKSRVGVVAATVAALAFYLWLRVLTVALSSESEPYMLSMSRSTT